MRKFLASSFMALERRRRAARFRPADLSIFSDFDPIFYRRINPELAERSDSELLRHFLDRGWQEGADPNAVFSVSLYFKHNPDVAEAGLNPYSHFLTNGKNEGRITFLSLWGNSSGLHVPADHLDTAVKEIDLTFLRTQLSDDMNALSDRDLTAYYLVQGPQEGLEPRRDFSTKIYTDANRDIVSAGSNPFLHYILYGRTEGRRTSGLGAPAGKAKPTPPNPKHDKDIARPHFDPEFYRTRYVDMAGASDEGGLEHFMLHGWREGRNPSANFNTQFYLEENADVRTAGINPLLHYIEIGASEGRPGQSTGTPQPRVSEGDLQNVRPHFDADFYRATNDDLSGSDEDLLQHFMITGWKERRDPSAEFSIDYYLEIYPDVSAGGGNPFLHYVLFGKAEGRRPRGDEPMRMVFNPSASLTPDHLQSVTHYPNSELPVPIAPLRVNTKSMDLHWIVPDFRRGSGGHMTIFRMIRHLELFGHRCKIWIENPVFHSTGEEAWEEIVKYFQCVTAEVDFVSNGFFETSGDAVIATGWSTAFLAERAKGFAGKFYFVQDHEVEFHPTGSERLLARQSYDFDLDCICASPWLDKLMSEKYGHWARHFYLAYDHETYRIVDKKAHHARFNKKLKGPCKIAVYARDHTARRCVSLALIALESLGARRQDFEVHFFGQETLAFFETPFPAVNHGVLNAAQLAELYNDCHIGICFSGTNYSLVPQEMMACGLPLVELNGDSTRAIFPDGVVSLGGPNPLDIAAKVASLIDDPELRKTQAETALDWVQEFSWEGSGRDVEGAIIERLSEKTKPSTPATLVSRDVLLDVVIPTWNGVGELEPVIEALRGQRDRDRIQIYCIDSSSSDGTIEWLKKQRDVSLTVIDQKEFQHGRTRNDGAALGSAPVVSFLTQDAMPTNSGWATDIIKMFDHVPEAAGLFGRHEPYPGHPLFVRDEITRHFANMLKYPLVLSKYTDPAKWESGDPGWRQFLHYYSDNNSAMRREVWKDIPYPEVDYGEDQVWARDIIEAGFSKLYAPTACVYHSHDYNPAETYKRSKTEGAFFYEHFGYELGLGSESEIADQVRREQMNFKSWARKKGIDQEEIDMRLANIAEKHRGLRDGRLEATERLGQRGRKAS